MTGADTRLLARADDLLGGRTRLPLLSGSGKFGTPWDRMQREYSSPAFFGSGDELLLEEA